LATPLGSEYNFQGLKELVARLRSADGCPWDQEQTHSSLRNALLEECHEVLNALDAGDTGNLLEELGDLLVQVVFHCQIAEDLGEFDTSAMFRTIISKLIRRHPHVFGNTTAKHAREVEENWEKIKATERSRNSSPLDSVPKSLPSLSFAHAISQRAARNGLRFPQQDEFSLINEITRRTEKEPTHTTSLGEVEFGTLLFKLIQMARGSGIDAESALRKTNSRFQNCFDSLTRDLKSSGRTVSDLSDAEHENFWKQVLI